MYKNYKNDPQISLDLEKFFLPFGGKLNINNRWIKLSYIVPWSDFEDYYASQLHVKNGAGALSFRIALGALIIKERLRITDREAVEQIKENPYLQYFLGFKKFTFESAFDPSMYVHFRKRISESMLSDINEAIIQKALSEKINISNVNNFGKLKIDATCTPADIRHPLDISLLNEAREGTENIIDALWEDIKDNTYFKKKPRTYRIRARKDFLNIIRKPSNRDKNPRKGIRGQLNYLQRNLLTISKLKEFVSLSILSRYQYKSLLVISEVYRQQKEMYDNDEHKITDRIVSISQPYVRPIVRKKSGKKVEFGAKISASSFMGYTTVDRISWDAYNEGGDLISQAKKYRHRFGCYPNSIHADKIYRNRENRKWCKEHSIRLSGPPLGRPKKVTKDNIDEIKHQKKIAAQDEKDRIDIEGKFGISKRRYGLDRVMTKLSDTSKTVISLVFLVMNLEKILKDLFYTFFCFLHVNFVVSIGDIFTEKYSKLAFCDINEKSNFKNM